MESDHQKELRAYRRSHDRISFQHQVILELPDRKIFYGITQDVSLRGVFLITNDLPNGIETGDKGFLQITITKQPKKFPCMVAHIRNQGIGLKLLDEGIQFGASLTEALMQETHLRLGSEISAIIPVILCPTSSLVTIRRLEARLIKINISYLECYFSPMLNASEPLKNGDAIKLEILPLHQPPILVEGSVRSVLNAQNPNPKNEKKCTVFFSSMAQNSSKAIQELIHLLHEQRLKKMMTQRSCSIALQTGFDHPYRTQPEMVKDLTRFFGPRS